MPGGYEKTSFFISNYGLETLYAGRCHLDATIHQKYLKSGPPIDDIIPFFS